MKYCENYQNVTQRCKLAKYCWKKWCQQTWFILSYHKSAIFLKPWNVCKANKAKCKKTRHACILTLENSVCPGKPGAPPSTLLPDLRFQVWVQHQCSVSLSHRGGKLLQSLSYQNRGKELALPLLPPRGTDNTHGNSCLWCSLPLPTVYEQNQESREWLLRHFQFCRDLILEFHIFKESSGLLMKFSINTL